MGPPYESLSFRDITEAYRREKRSKELTEIRPDFYSAVTEFVERNKRENEEEMTKDPFSLKALSISDMIKKASSKAIQIWEIRAEKILLMALRASSGAGVDTSRLTKGEKKLFEHVLAALNGARYEMLSKGAPRPMAVEEREQSSAPPEEVPSTPQVLGRGVDEEPEGMERIEERPSEHRRDRIVVRVLEDIPPFAGPERNYELKREEVITLPTVVGRALVERGMAVEIDYRRRD